MNSLPFVLKMKKHSLPLRSQNNEKSVFLQKRKKMVLSSELCTTECWNMGNRIPDEIVEQVQKSADIVEVIGEYVQLRKQGRN